jgi:hypothetical protein
MARQMPAAPPVTIATLPSRRPTQFLAMPGQRCRSAMPVSR